ncbi:HEPN domain-containing protein [Staphylococcus simulans]|uniref:HEPN domain-containing protein n=1 Tax=Staphylococcus simulans TaxID=1286 RepID=UPI003F7D1919
MHRRFTSKKGTTLVQRYKELLYRLDEPLQNYLRNCVNYHTSLNKDLKNYRNYHSHYFPSQQKPVYEQDTDDHIGEYVVQLLKAFILTHMGMPSNAIIQLLKATHL